MSNRALLLATRAVRAERRQLSSFQEQQLDWLDSTAKASPCAQKSRAVSYAYGDHVARVDWALSPGDFFLTPVRTRNDSSRRAAMTDRVPADAIGALVALPLQDFRLMKENGEHFGARALYSFRLWHRKAMETARAAAHDSTASRALERGVALALVYNAFADHYLEDLFAPGHIASPRGGLNEPVAGGLHNYHNKRGAYFRPTGAARLRGYLAGGAALPSDDLKPSLASLVRTVCAGGPSDACVEQALGGQSLLVMHGDDMLDALSSGDDDNFKLRVARQELYVTLVIARSVQDVLDAWLAADGQQLTDNFAVLRACGYAQTGARRDGTLEWEYPFVATPFGHYIVEKGAGLPPLEHWPTVRLGYEVRANTGSYTSVGVEHLRTAWIGDWFGSPPGRRGTNDRSTYVGFEARMPHFGRKRDEIAAGPTVRRTWAYNRVNAQLSLAGGARVGSRFVEAHAGPVGQIGFALLHLEVRPGLAWRPATWGGYAGPGKLAVTLQSSVSVTPPWTPRRVSPRTDKLPSAGPPQRQCLDQEVEIGL
jgi:hypothetical protein